MFKFYAILFLGLVAYARCQSGGHFFEVDTNDTTIKRIASFAVQELGSEYELQRVVSAMQQVVSGMNYKIKLDVTRSVNGQKKKRSCHVLVYEIVWESYLELEEFHCHFTDKLPRL